MSARSSLVVLDAPLAGPGVAGLLLAVLRRITWRALLVAAGITLTIHQFASLGGFGGGQIFAPDAPPRFWISVVVIESIACLCVLVGVKAGEEMTARGSRRFPTYAVCLVTAAAVAATLQWFVRDLFDLPVYTSKEEFLIRITNLAGVFFEVALFGGLATFAYVNIRTARAAAARMLAAEIERARTRRRTLESRLQALQARVEPQFLFNTLAQVKQLYEIDPPRGNRMLDELIAYLRAALPHLREATSTLGKEVELARAYLNIMQLRLGDRLAYTIDLPPGLAAVRMPPMMLLPLIDHALAYGIAPTQAGRSLRISSSLGNGKLRLIIEDSGGAFAPGGSSADLVDIEERLHALYGDAGQLRLEQVPGRGTQGVMEIPNEPA